MTAFRENVTGFTDYLQTKSPKFRKLKLLTLRHNFVILQFWIC